MRENGVAVSAAAPRGEFRVNGSERKVTCFADAGGTDEILPAIRASVDLRVLRRSDHFAARERVDQRRKAVRADGLIERAGVPGAHPGAVVLHPADHRVWRGFRRTDGVEQM